MTQENILSFPKNFQDDYFQALLLEKEGLRLKLQKNFTTDFF